MGDIVGFTSVVLVFGIPIIAILTAHHRRVLELKVRLRETAANASTEEIAALRQELRDLRETATQYDLSFDAMLQRLEGRIERLEGQVRAIGGASSESGARIGVGEGGD